jgi:hypothetical protein
MVVSEDEIFTPEQAEAFGVIVRSALAQAGELDRGVIAEWSPLPPYQSRFRPLPLEGAKPWPWLIRPEPRLLVRLRVRRFDIYGSERDNDDLAAALRHAKAQIGAVLVKRVFLHEALVEGTVDSDRDDDLSKTERELVLDFGVQLTEV